MAHLQPIVKCPYEEGKIYFPPAEGVKAELWATCKVRNFPPNKGLSSSKLIIIWEGCLMVERLQLNNATVTDRADFSFPSKSGILEPISHQDFAGLSVPDLD